MTNFKHIKALLVSAACLFLFSCGGGSDAVSSAPSTSIQTIKWQLDNNGYVQFFTSDAQYYGYGFWNTYTQTNETQMTTVTATVKKESGCPQSGYGIVFCYQDNNNYYRLLIDTAGHYTVQAKVGGTSSVIIPWMAPQSAIIYGVGVQM